MISKGSAGFLGLVVFLSAGVARAQSIPELRPGARVRLVAAAFSRRPLVGTVSRLDATAVELQTADRNQPTLVPRDAITRVEISVGRRSRSRGALIGGSLGAAIGVIAVLATPGEPCEPNLFGCPPFGITKGMASVLIGGIGAASGALIGSLIPPGERWKAPAAGRLSIAPAGARGVQAALSFRF